MSWIFGLQTQPLGKGVDHTEAFAWFLLDSDWEVAVREAVAICSNYLPEGEFMKEPESSMSDDAITEVVGQCDRAYVHGFVLAAPGSIPKSA
jgi:hypothetical protein